jgi:D-glycero-D-manno-heptose 1,7-bisphosphate phosphatase
MNVPVCDPVVTDASATTVRMDAAPRRALFLDRDGVININHGYVHTPERTEWVAGIFDLARAARAGGYALVVVTNQAGIARGFYSPAQFEDYTRWMHGRFADEGAPILATYYCPHHPDAGIGELKVRCGCRKPAPGMLLRAIADYRLDPDGSMLVGDSGSDIQAADAAGIGRALQLEGTAHTHRETIRILEQWRRSHGRGAGGAHG